MYWNGPQKAIKTSQMIVSSLMYLFDQGRHTVWALLKWQKNDVNLPYSHVKVTRKDVI